MEGKILNTRGCLWVNSDIFWTYGLPGYLSSNNEQFFERLNRHWKYSFIYRQYTSINGYWEEALDKLVENILNRMEKSDIYVYNQKNVYERWGR